jgi:hypothetical protein
MRKHNIPFLMICIASSAFAQPSQRSGDTQAAEVVSADNMPMAPPEGELEKLQNGIAARAPDGFSSVERSPEKVKGFFIHLNTVKAALANGQQAGFRKQADVAHSPEVHKNLSQLSLTFKAAAFDKGALIAVAPAGTKIDKSWTGLDRFFQLPGAGVMRLTEYDLGATGGKFFMAKEAVNTSVNGQPAISKVFVGENGLSIEEIVWVSGRKFYMLTFSPDLAAGTQLKAAPHVSALSLALQLQSPSQQ